MLSVLLAILLVLPVIPLPQGMAANGDIKITFDTVSQITDGERTEQQIAPGSIPYAKFKSYPVATFAGNAASYQGKECVWKEWRLLSENPIAFVYPNDRTFDANVTLTPGSVSLKSDVNTVTFQDVDGQNTNWTFYLLKTEKDGYNATAWAQKFPKTTLAEGEVWAANGTEVTSSSAVPNADATYTREYKVTLDKTAISGGTETAITTGKKITLSTLDAITGYDVSWTDASGKTVFGEQTIDNGTTTFRAVKTPKQYTITWNANGGTFENGQTSATTKQTYYAALEFPANNPTKENYTFGGWFTAAENGEPVSKVQYQLAEDKTFFAHWTDASKPQIKVTIDLNDGTSSTSSFTISSNNDANFAQIKDPSREGYKFLGWKLQHDGSGDPQTENSQGVINALKVAITALESGIDNYTITAQWEQETTDPSETITITLNPNGGTVTQTTVAVKKGETYLLPIPTYTGYNFLGWYTDEGTEVSPNGTVGDTMPTKLTAKWEPASVGKVTIKVPQGAVIEDIYLLDINGERPNQSQIKVDGTNDGTTTTIPVTITASTGDYNLVVEAKKDNQTWTTTKKVTLPLKQAVIDLVDPKHDILLNIESQGAIVSGLESFLSGVSGATEIVFTATQKTESAPGGSEIKQKAAGKSLKFMDFTIKKNDAEQKESPELLEITIKISSAWKNIEVFRYHNNQVEKLSGQANGDGEFFTQNGDTLTIRSKKFSTYAIAYNEETGTKPSNPSHGGTWYPSATYYSVKTEKHEHGTVTASPSSIYSGGTVTLTVNPEKGYKLDKLAVTDSQGKTVELTEKNGKYIFKMPSRNVTVKAEFVSATAPSPTPTPTPTPSATPEPTPTPDTSPSPAPKHPFTDVKQGIWYEEAVQYVFTKGLIKGTTATTFGPDVQITRGMIVTILHRMENEPKVNSASKFTDVKDGNYFCEAVKWATENKVVKGYGNGKFGPNDPITREQMAAILYRYAEYKSYDISQQADLSAYVDAGKLSSYAVTPMRWANATGLVKGITSNKLAPDGLTRRCEAATLFMRFSQKFGEK